ncbi:MAG: WD40/YVTN/BNR-like repeat-containing protein [Ktedonobacterales bacterium]
MISATAGWAVLPTNGGVDNEIALTQDGGHTWYNVTPSGLNPNQSGNGEAPQLTLYPISSTEAWAWIASDAGGESTTLWHTTNAGAHWSTIAVATGSVIQLDFVDSLHGWLAATPNGGGAGQYPIDVWRTTDGGATWAKVASDPVAGRTTGISFANDTTGFATANGSGGPLLLAVTHDGGSTWSKVSLPTPASNMGAVVEPPVFTSATDGVLIIMYPIDPALSTLAVYRTSDTGSIWVAGPPPTSTTTGPESPGLLTSTISTGEVFVASIGWPNVNVPASLLSSGATAWTVITPTSSSVGLLKDMTQLDFVDATHGWALTKYGLIGTADAGVTWTVLHS